MQFAEADPARGRAVSFRMPVSYTHLGELFMLRHAQLANDENVQGSGECTSDFSCDGHAAARQTEYDDI